MAQRPAHAQNHRHPDEPRAEDIARALKGADYPLGKEALVTLAKKNGADGEVMAVLERMTARHFDSETVKRTKVGTNSLLKLRLF